MRQCGSIVGYIVFLSHLRVPFLINLDKVVIAVSGILNVVFLLVFSEKSVHVKGTQYTQNVEEEPTADSDSEDDSEDKVHFISFVFNVC